MSIRIVDMPDLGAVTDDSSVVGEHAGSGRFAMTAMRNYITTTGGGPFLPLTGGNLTGALTTSATANIFAGANMYVTAQLFIGPQPSPQWQFIIESEVIEFSGMHSAFMMFSYHPPVSGNGVIIIPVSMSLSVIGDLLTAASVTSPYIHATGNATVDGTLTAGAINAPGGTYTGTTVSVTGNISGNNIGAAGSITANASVNCADLFTTKVHIADPSGFLLQIDGGGNRSIYFSSTWSFTWTLSNGNLGYYRTSNTN